MIKKQLLSMRPLNATATMIKTAKDNPPKIKQWTETHYGHVYHKQESKAKYGRYFRAVVENNILKVAVFTQDHLQNERKTPDYEVYVDRENNQYMTYDVIDQKWRTAMISMLPYTHYSYMYQSGEWQKAKDRAAVNRYFHTGANLSIYEAVLEFQSDIKKDALQKKHKNELNQIDSVMREVPELPKNFEKWVLKNCFSEIMFYQPDSMVNKYAWPKMYCTHCGQWMDTGWTLGLIQTSRHTTKRAGALAAKARLFIRVGINKSMQTKE